MVQLSNFNIRIFRCFFYIFPFFTYIDLAIGMNDTTIFSATILDGSCEWEWNESTIIFSAIKPENISPGKTLEIKPLSVLINCNMALTPRILVSGITPYINNDKIFLDPLVNHIGSPQITNGVGFMLLPDNGSTPSLSDFYSQINNALSNTQQAININPITDAKKPTQQIIWIGIVGMTEGEQVIHGAFSASIIFTGYIP